MLPSRRLIILVMAGAPIFLAGALYGPFVTVGLVYVAALALAVMLDAVMLPRRRHVRVRRVVPERISLGVPTRVAFVVETSCRRRLEVRLAEDLPAHLEAEPAETAGVFEPGAKGELEYRLTARKRGRHRLLGVDVRVLPAMGLLYRQLRLDLPADIHVFPNLVNLKRYELLLRRGQAAEGKAKLRRIGQGSEFESLRPYVIGDEMGRMDWKATAKHSRLVVRNFQPERQQSVLLAIDAGRATATEFMGMSRLDYFVNAALMFAYVALRQGDWFSLVAFSDRIESYLPPIRQVKNIDCVARALYELKTNLAESDYDNACRFLGLKSRKRSLVCMMTDVIDVEASGVVVSYMARFARYHLPLLVTLSDRDVRRVAEAPLEPGQDMYSKAVALDVLAAREQALTAMRHQGVSVLDVVPQALTPDLINRYLFIKTTRRL